MCISIHSCIQAYRYTALQECTNTDMHAFRNLGIQVHRYTCIQAFTHAGIHFNLYIAILPHLFFLSIFVQLIQIYSVDWTVVYGTHNIEHKKEPISQWLSIDSGVFCKFKSRTTEPAGLEPAPLRC